MWKLWQREIFYDVILRSQAASVPIFSLLFFPPHSPIDVIILWNPVCCTLAWHNRSLRSRFTLMQPCRKCTRNIWCNKGRRISGRMTNVATVSASQQSMDLVGISYRFISFRFVSAKRWNSSSWNRQWNTAERFIKYEYNHGRKFSGLKSWRKRICV